MSVQPCFFIDEKNNRTAINLLDSCPDVGPRGELVYVMMTPSQFRDVSAIPDIFAFDLVLFGQFVLYFILLFLGGYFTGLIARKLGR